MTLPDRLSAALSSRHPLASAPGHHLARRGILRRGDIRRVEPCSDPNDAMRLALVLDEDHDEGSVEIMLVHPYVELATETDLVFTPDETGAPYPVVVETTVRSAVCTYQVRRSSKRVGKRVGSLSTEALEEIGKVVAAADPSIASLRTGLPLAGPADSRWSFKQHEVKALNQLAADRISAVFNDSPIPQWPSLPLTPLNSDAPSLMSEFDRLSESEFTLDDLAKLSEIGTFDQDTWARQSKKDLGQFGRDLGRDLCNSSKLLIDRALAYED